MKTTKIIRYSTTGFKPRKQNHHMKEVNYHLYNFNINDFPELHRYSIQQIHNKKLEFYKSHYDDFKEGVWFFLDGYKNNQSLNHIKHKVPCWKAEIESDVLVYDCNWEQIIPLTDPMVKFGGCYLPKSQIHKIHNIAKRNNKASQ